MHYHDLLFSGYAGSITNDMLCSHGPIFTTKSTERARLCGQGGIDFLFKMAYIV